MSHPALLHADHRPWPLPRHPWVMQMTWHDLLFEHWRVPAKALRAQIPADLEIEEFDGSAWLGIVPFVMTARLRGTPTLPGSKFAELNVRTYVRHRDKSGVWFFSLDAASRLAVWGARRFFYLPYYYATMSSKIAGSNVHYRSQRAANPEVRFECSYRPISEPRVPPKGSLEHWLTERYCLFSSRRNRLYCGEIHHEPWELQQAEAENEVITMTKPLGFAIPPERPLLLFAKRQDVVAWWLERLE